MTKEFPSRNADSLMNGITEQPQQWCTHVMGFVSHSSRNTKDYQESCCCSVILVPISSDQPAARTRRWCYGRKSSNAMKEKVAMPMYLKPREALLPISNRNQVSSSAPSLEVSRVLPVCNTTTWLGHVISKRSMLQKDFYVFILGHAEICKLLLQSRGEYKFTANNLQT